MCENVNINVSETNETINIVSSEIQEVIDINVFETTEDVTLNITEEIIQVNINKVTSAEQIQSDWNQTDVDALDFIKNKPTSTSDFINDGEDGVNPFITAADIPASVTSVGLTMPSAFSVANSPITSAGTLEVTGAGLVSQYVRGDGSLANFPTSTGGGASLSFYLNGSVSQGTFGGVAFREMDRTPILGAGTDFTISSNGYIQSFITDANVPNLLKIPAGNWNFETYFSASSGGGSPSFYLELYKWDGTTLSLIASNSANPEGITNGTAIDLYVSALAVPQTTLLATDRLAVRIYVTPSGRTIKLHTEDNHLCQVITTFSTGITALNGLTAQVQSFATGTSGTDFAISSTTATHTFNLPTASAANRGALSSTDWSTFNNKANDSLVVHLAGTETITGAKTFQNITTITPAALTGTAATSALDIAQTWNTTGTPALIKANVTNTASNASSTLLSLQSNSNNIFRILNTGQVYLGSNNNVGFWVNDDGTNTPLISGRTLVISHSLSTQSQNGIVFRGANSLSATSGTQTLGNFLSNFTPTSGNAIFNSLLLQPTINQTGGASGITRGLYINPTLTAAADFRAIETTAGNVLLNTTSGNTLIGTSTNAGFKLDVNGTARFVSDIRSTTGVFIGTTATFAGIFPTGTAGRESLLIRSNLVSTDSGTDIAFNNAQGDVANLSGTRNLTDFSRGFNPTSGSGIYNLINIRPTINQGVGAVGITRGIFISPTLTSVTDFRAIDIVSGITVLAPSVTARASLRIPSGTAPTSPTNGDIWFDGTDLKIRVAGVTRTIVLL